MSDTYHKRLAQIKAVYPRAYEQWTEREESRLLTLVQKRKSTAEIAQILQRQPSAISSRLRKLKQRQAIRSTEASQSSPNTGTTVPEKPPKPVIPEPETVAGLEITFKVSFSFEWQPVLAGVDTPYVFPQPISPFMTARYKWPAVYRWLIMTPQEARPVIYVGITKKLCPDRLKGYIEPKGSTTNQRMNVLLHDYLLAGSNIRLGILQNCKTNIDDDENGATYSFRNQTNRLVIEELLVAHYKQQGFVLLNA